MLLAISREFGKSVDWLLTGQTPKCSWPYQETRWNLSRCPEICAGRADRSDGRSGRGLYHVPRARCYPAQWCPPLLQKENQIISGWTERTSRGLTVSQLLSN